MPWNASLLRTTVCGWRSAVSHWLMGKDPDLLEVMGLWLLILAVRGCLKSSIFILTIMEICESDSEGLIIARSGTYPKYLFFSGLLMLHWSCLSVDENIQSVPVCSHAGQVVCYWVEKPFQGHLILHSAAFLKASGDNPPKPIRSTILVSTCLAELLTLFNCITDGLLGQESALRVV